MNCFPGSFLSGRPSKKLPCGKFEICKVRNMVCLGKGQCWMLWLSMGQFFFSSPAIFSWLNPMFRGSPKGLHHRKIGSCREKISVLLQFFFLDSQGPQIAFPGCTHWSGWVATLFTTSRYVIECSVQNFVHCTSNIYCLVQNFVHCSRYRKCKILVQSTKWQFCIITQI